MSSDGKRIGLVQQTQDQSSSYYELTVQDRLKSDPTEVDLIFHADTACLQ